MEWMEVLDHRDELMELLEEHDPQQHQRMVRLEQLDPQAFALALVRVGKQVERLKADPAAQDRFRQLKEEEARVRALASGYAELSGADQKRRRAELEAAAERIMELKQAERRARVEELRRHIAEIEADIEARDADKKRLVDAFVDQLLTERVDL
jgi:Tfp pilus assembly protein FimV